MLVYRKSATTIGTLLWVIRLVLIVACLSINDAYWGKTFAETIYFSDQNSNTLPVGCFKELFNTQYMTNPTIVSPVKMEYG